MSLQNDFDFNAHIAQIIFSTDSSNVIKLLIDEKSKFSSVNNNLILENMLLLYINGDLDDSYVSKALSEIIELLENADYEILVYDLFENFDKMLENMSKSEQYEFLQKMLNIEKKSFEYTRFIWSYSVFRSLIEYFPFYTTAQDFVSHGFFRTLFSNTGVGLNCDVQKYLYCYEELLKDKLNYKYLIKYLHKIIELNEPFTSINFEINSKEKKCSRFDFNIFIFKFLEKIYLHNFDQINKKEIFCEKINIKNFAIDNLPLDYQIYVTILYGMHVFIPYFTKTYDLIRETKTKKSKKFKKILSENWIQDFYTEYSEYFHIFGIEILFNDIINYTNVILTYNKSDTMNITINPKIYEIISNVLGGINNTIQNVHIRYNCLIFIERYVGVSEQGSCTLGYDVFTNFFDNLFKYINEVSFDSLAFLYINSKLIHQYLITQMLLMMTDYFTSIGDQSKFIFAETIFKMIGISFELFDLFDDELYDKIKFNFGEISAWGEYYNMAIETAIHTILIYNNLYDRQIIKTIYPETEEKYLSFIERIISNVKMCSNNKFQLNQINSDLDKELLRICFESINTKILKNDELILNMKDKLLYILPSINESIFDPSIKINIIEYFDKNKEDDIDYPSEFLDPITCVPIKNPVMIPNINDLIFERTYIVMQIYTSKTNPYNRDSLDLEILENHNNKEEIIQKIKEFKNKKEKFIKEYKKINTDSNANINKDIL